MNYNHANDHLEIVRFLINRGVDIHVQNDSALDAAQHNANDNNPLNMPEQKHADPMLIDKLKKIADKPADTEYNTCTICTINKKIIVFGCGHRICAQCAISIISTNNVCPQCRSPIDIAIQTYD